MKIKVELWKISDLIRRKNDINPKPQYQRTSVWSPVKKKLLIDSILRGYDIPKFYLTATPNAISYKYEVTDGQQRMRSVWEFADAIQGFNLDEAVIGTLNTKGLSFKEFKTKHKKQFQEFLDYEINVAIIKNTSQEEIRTLFARLQMGERLNPTELRHALASNIGNAIYSIVENHNFFEDDCKISNSRYKHQDYLDNVATLCHYDGNRNIKAIDMKHLYIELANTPLNEMQPLLLKINKVLDLMKKINNFKKGIFKNKWGFVDMFYLIFKNIALIKDVKPKICAESLFEFERIRRAKNSNPETLIDDKTSLNYDKDMYDYIIAFKTSGAEKGNIKIRHRVFTNKFLNSTNFDLK